jgi:hypothetical protein
MDTTVNVLEDVRAHGGVKTIGFHSWVLSLPTVYDEFYIHIHFHGGPETKEYPKVV